MLELPGRCSLYFQLIEYPCDKINGWFPIRGNQPLFFYPSQTSYWSCTLWFMVKDVKMLLCFSSLYPVALAGGAAALRLYSRKVSSMDKWKRKRKLSIVNRQFSIVSASFWWALSEGTKWSGRSVAVWAKRVCGAHSETKRRSSSADAALTFWFFWVKPKERTQLGLSQKNDTFTSFTGTTRIWNR